jgi:hypothetical protein
MNKDETRAVSFKLNKRLKKQNLVKHLTVTRLMGSKRKVNKADHAHSGGLDLTWMHFLVAFLIVGVMGACSHESKNYQNKNVMSSQMVGIAEAQITPTESAATQATHLWSGQFSLSN